VRFPLSPDKQTLSSCAGHMKPTRAYDPSRSGWSKLASRKKGDTCGGSSSSPKSILATCPHAILSAVFKSIACRLRRSSTGSTAREILVRTSTASSFVLIPVQMATVSLPA
ncbi:unnamed protein product, partial [Ectocarpus sp. 12 AP-2014]